MSTIPNAVKVALEHWFEGIHTREDMLILHHWFDAEAIGCDVL